MKINDDVIKELAGYAGFENILENEPMAGHLTMEAGGPAAYYITPCGEEALAGVIKILNREALPYYVIGNGSNVIVRDEGYDGVIIGIGEGFSKIETEGTVITAGAGALLKEVSKAALEAGLTGFEFASGIPGSVGGGASMNAGAYAGEMKDIVKEVRAVTSSGDTETFSNEDMMFGYRKSRCSGGSCVIVSVKLQLREGDPSEIKEKIDDLTERRARKQPLEYPSCGSTFKRPEGYFAGKLIMDSGLRGYRVGGAQVSEKHCGFVINRDHATASDILTLIEDVKKIVLEKQGVSLECEVKIL